MPRYNKPKDFEITTVPLPELRDDDVLVKVKACGVCGTGMFDAPESKT
jgi:D-arabinitol dehydrogenase (NADP+)